MSARGCDLAVIVACFNRAEMTVRAVRQVLESASRAGVQTHVYVLNDGSTDQTSAGLASIGDKVVEIQGPGNYYWAHSMAEAEKIALREVTPDGHLLWLNDDVDLRADAIERALQEASQDPTAVYVGMTTDPIDPSVVSYAAFQWRGPHPLKFRQVTSNNHNINAFNGNFVLVPTQIALKLGGIDGGYSHALADIDYGQRLTRVGTAIKLVEQPIGSCPRNASATDGIKRQWQEFVGPKGGGNYESLSRYLRKFRPHSWVAWVVVTYAQWWRRALTNAVVARIGKRSTITFFGTSSSTK